MLRGTQRRRAGPRAHRVYARPASRRARCERARRRHEAVAAVRGKARCRVARTCPVAAGPFTERRRSQARTSMAISPGVAKDQPAIAAAVANGAELAGDIELFARELPPEQKVLADHRLERQIDRHRADGRALPRRRVSWRSSPATSAMRCSTRCPRTRTGRTSSCSSSRASSWRRRPRSCPRPAAVLNITDNHLDRYAGIDDYAAAKARIFHGGGIEVLNRDDPRSIAMRIPGRLVQTFGAGVPESEEAWGLVDRGTKGSGMPESWLARGGALLAAGVRPRRSSGNTTRSTRWRRWRSHLPSSKIDRRVLASARRVSRACRTGCSRSPTRAACCTSTIRRARRSPRRARRSPDSTGRSY